MADARITLGGTISVCTTDEMHSAIGDLENRLRSGRKPEPIYRPLSQYISIGNMNQFDARILELGSPPSGRLWYCTRLTVLGNGDTAALTGVSAAMYVGDPANAALSQCVQHGTAIPFTTIENERAFPIHSRESLFINIVATGSATGVTVTANAVVWEYPEDYVTQMVI